MESKRSSGQCVFSPAIVCAQWVSHVIVERVIDEEKGRVGASGRTL